MFDIDAQVHSLIFIKMLTQEIPRKPISQPEYLQSFKMDDSMMIMDGP
jgi:hypothetical protein